MDLAICIFGILSGSLGIALLVDAAIRFFSAQKAGTINGGVTSVVSESESRQNIAIPLSRGAGVKDGETRVSRRASPFVLF